MIASPLFSLCMIAKASSKIDPSWSLSRAETNAFAHSGLLALFASPPMSEPITS